VTSGPTASAAPAASSALRLRAVEKVYGADTRTPVRALRGVDLDVLAEETVCLIGPSGCGKTTLLRCVNRLERADAGEILVRGRESRAWDPIELRRSIGYVIQRGGLFPHLTVQENIALLCRLEGWERTRIEARCAELLALVQLEPDEFRARYPRELSGGQRQRVGIARALALDPDIVLMDEPFGALDPITRTELQSEFRALARRVGKTVLLVTHDLNEAFALGSRVALMLDGRVEQIGRREDFEQRPASSFVEHFLERFEVARP